MKAIILGLGQVGYSIARYLAHARNHIAVVDHSSLVLDHASDKIDVQPILGFASYPDVLNRAGAAEADLLIAVTSSDEINIVACEVANSLFNIPTKIARIRNQDYLNNKTYSSSQSKLAIDIAISPEIEVAQAINRNLRVSGAFDVISIANGNLKLLGVRCLKNSSAVNTPVKSLANLFPQVDIAVVLITRDDKIIFPKGKDILLANDEIYILVPEKQVEEVMEIFGYENSESREILIIGGGNIGLNLAMAIEKNHKNIHASLIEKDIKRAEQIALYLKRTEILQGDALDYDILQEANISSCETVISVSNDDKVNILSSLICKRQGAKRALSLLNNMQYANMATSIGADAIISPQSLTVTNILKHIREGNFTNVFPIADGHAVVIEAIAKETSNIVGLEIEDVTLTNEIMVMALIREDILYFFPQNMHISASDRLIITTEKNSVYKVEKLFSIRPYYI